MRPIYKLMLELHDHIDEIITKRNRTWDEVDTLYFPRMTHESNQLTEDELRKLKRIYVGWGNTESKYKNMFVSDNEEKKEKKKITV